LTAPNSQTSATLARYRYAGPRPLERELYSGGTAGHQDTVFGWDGQRREEQLRVETKSPSLTELWRWDYRMAAEGHLTQERYYVANGFIASGSKYHELDSFYRLTGSKAGVPLNDLDTKTYAQSGFTERRAYVLDSGHNRASETVEKA